MHGLKIFFFLQVDPTDIPSKRQLNKDSRLTGNWVQSKISQGFDSVQLNRSGLDVTVLWDPFPAIATHKVILDVAALRILAGKVQAPRQVFKQEFVQFKLPGKLLLGFCQPKSC